MKTLKASEEFVFGKHNIGYVNPDFLKHCANTDFEERPMPTFQVLPRNMTNAEIESELKVGICDLGDIIALLGSNVTGGYKDGLANLFYTDSFVVIVFWYSVGRYWYVDTCGRGARGWDAGRRVFSRNCSVPTPIDAQTLVSFDTSKLKSLKKQDCYLGSCVTTAEYQLGKLRGWNACLDYLIATSKE
jgi:hypothetical protein